MQICQSHCANRSTLWWTKPSQNHKRGTLIQFWKDQFFQEIHLKVLKLISFSSFNSACTFVTCIIYKSQKSLKIPGSLAHICRAKMYIFLKILMKYDNIHWNVSIIYVSRYSDCLSAKISMRGQNGKIGKKCCTFLQDSNTKKFSWKKAHLPKNGLSPYFSEAILFLKNGALSL